MRIVIPVMGLVLLFSIVAFSETSMTITEEQSTFIKKITAVWVTDDSNAWVTGQTIAEFTGKVLGIATVPSSVSAPTDNYDVTILDADGLDILAGSGMDRDTANVEYIFDKSLLGAVSNDRLILNVTAAGNITEGTIYVFFK